MRVLVSAETFLPVVNGVTNSALRAIDHLDARGHEVQVIAPGPGPNRHRLSSGREIPVRRVPGWSLPMYRSIRCALPNRRSIRQVIDAFDPDVVHLAAPVVLGSRVGSLAQEAGVPTVALFQTDLAGFIADYGFGVAAPPVWRQLRSIHNRADLTLALTPTLSRELQGRGFDRVEVWGRGVDHQQFEPERRSMAFRETYGAADGRIAIGYVGRLAAEKRVDHLAVLAGDPRVKLVIVGDGPDRDRLERLLPGASFVGFRHGAALGEAMASLDIFVHTGRHETFCQTIQEAMSCRIPVVAPAAGGPLDLIEPGVNGFLYQPDSAAHLAATLEPLIVDAGLRREIGLAGRHFVADKTWSAIGDQLIEHYRRVIDQPPRRRDRRRQQTESIPMHPAA